MLAGQAGLWFGIVAPTNRVRLNSRALDRKTNDS